jgi:hypothetical protein
MNRRKSCFYFFSILALALCFPAFSVAQRDNDRDREHGRDRDRDRELLPGPGWQVMHAEWGAEGRHVDVTNRVRVMLSGNGSVKVNNTNLGGDPAEGERKILHIRARNFRGESREFNFAEGDYIDASRFYNYNGGFVEDNVPGWRVMWAEWGSGDRFVDVTKRVRELLSGEGTVKVNNTNLGGDPAEGAKKVLRISARDPRGEVRQFAFEEGQYIEVGQFYNYRRAHHREDNR